MESTKGGGVNSPKPIISPVVWATSQEELLELKALGVEEIIIGLRDFSIMGKLSQKEGILLTREAQKLGMQTFLQWDLLMTENILTQKIAQITSFLEQGRVDALRVQDEGALQWAQEETALPLHLITERGNHNLKALEGWVQLIGKRLQRLILSPEIPRDWLKVYGGKLPCALEVLGLGPLLLFWTPRPLTEALGHDLQDDFSFLATCDESAHRDFPVLSNTHGTFLFHQKHHWLLEHGRELAAMGITHLRLDVKSFEWKKRALRLLKEGGRDAATSFQKDYPHPLIRGFFSRNKSHVLFPKLKNEKLELWRDEAIGEVVGVERDGLMGIELKGGAVMKAGESYRIQTPEGKKLVFTVNTLQELSSDFVVVNGVKSVGPKSFIIERGSESKVLLVERG